ncbi:MAG TPA: hypothetical protein VGO40_05095 [Longimicrobium sp.]|jgi:hypothetical protein|nr:hypothetical protein [Longimicrobium sp.]
MKLIRLRIPMLAGALLATVSAVAGGAAWRGGSALRHAVASPNAGYTPAYRFRTGTEVVMVFVGTSTCRATKEKGFPAVLERVKVAASRRAAAEGKQFRVIGVAMDNDTDVGLRFLRKFGKFDELAVGGNWMNQEVVRYVWRDLPYRPSVPQLVVLEREIRKEKTVVWVSPEREVRRLLGTDEIRRWGDAGAPFTGALPRVPERAAPAARQGGAR